MATLGWGVWREGGRFRFPVLPHHQSTPGAVGPGESNQRPHSGVFGDAKEGEHFPQHGLVVRQKIATVDYMHLPGGEVSIEVAQLTAVQSPAAVGADALGGLP